MGVPNVKIAILNSLTFGFAAFFLIFSFFWPAAALGIYLAGLFLQIPRFWIERKNKAGILGQIGGAAQLYDAVNSSQGGWNQRVNLTLNKILLFLLWPQQLFQVVVILIAAKGNALILMRFGRLLFPRFLLFIPVIAILATSTYRYGARSGNDLLFIIATSASSLTLFLFLLLITAQSFRPYVSRNLVHPVANAILIFFLVTVSTILTAAILRAAVDGESPDLQKGLAQIFDIEKIITSSKLSAVGELAGRADLPFRDSVIYLVLFATVVLYYVTFARVIFSGLVFGRTEDGILDIAE